MGMKTDQELYGRRGRHVTDQDANDITRVEELAYDLKVEEVMTREPITVSPDSSMESFLELLRTHRISGAPVVRDSQLIGIVSLEDLIRSLREKDMNAPVTKYMSANVITVHSYEPLVKSIQTFSDTKLGRLPVIDLEGRLVGMITKGDVTRGIFIALQKDYQEEEVRRYRASHLFEDIISDRTSLIMRYSIKQGDFTHGGEASSRIKRALLRLGAHAQVARRCGIAIYEAEMNLIIHTTNGGMIRVEIEPDRISMRVADDGPGIKDVDMALRAGYSTATEEVREMGFGAGMGLFNIRRCVDKMDLISTPGKGTRLEMRINLNPQDSLTQTGYFEEEKNKHESK